MRFLKKVPFVRIWANLFDFKGKETFVEYLVDYFMWLATALPFLVLTIVYYYRWINTEQDIYIPLMLGILLLYLRIPLLAMSARRFRATDNPWKLCFLILMPFGFAWAPLVCLNANSKEKLGDKYRKANRDAFLAPSIIGAVAFVLTLIPRIVLFSHVFIVIPFYPVTFAKSFDIEKYEHYRGKIEYANEGLPELHDVEGYSNIYFSYRESSTSLIFSHTHGIALFVDYGVNYEEKKEILLSPYTFISEPITSNYNSNYIFPVSEFTYKNYNFKIALTERAVYHSSDGRVDYSPKSFTMVGTNDADKSLAFLYYFDFDIDWLCERGATQEEKNECMPNLIEEVFFWRS